MYLVLKRVFCTTWRIPAVWHTNKKTKLYVCIDHLYKVQDDENWKQACLNPPKPEFLDKLTQAKFKILKRERERHNLIDQTKRGGRVLTRVLELRSPPPRKRRLQVFNWLQTCLQTLTLAADMLSNMVLLSLVSLLPILTFNFLILILRYDGRRLESACSITLYIKNCALLCFLSSGSSLSIFE